MTNQDLHERLLLLLENGYAVLAESERFVHQIQRQFRLRQIKQGKSGWEVPKIFTLNRWMENFWTDRWPGEMPASSFFLRWQYLKDCLHEAPPPEPLTADVELIHLLDESFEQCLRYAIDPAADQDIGGLIDWRRRVWRSFDERLARNSLFHPGLLPEKISRLLPSLDRQFNSGKLAFVGFEFAGDLEKQLLEELQKKFGAIFFALPAGNTQPEHLVYPDPEQEITGLMENLLKSVKECDPHEIAVVLCDSELYSPAVSAMLQDILGEPVMGEWAAYNLCPDRNLTGQGLYNAAVLPIRCALGGERRNDLFAFLRSPYYGALSPRNRCLSLWDKIWREKGVESGIDLLLSQVSDIGYQVSETHPSSDIRHPTPDTRHPTPDTRYLTSEIRNAIVPFLHVGARTVSHWTESLRRCWTALQFPVLANELDRITWDNLLSLISDFETATGEASLGAHEFFEILTAAAGRVRIQKSGFEDAGVQVLSQLDARGLCFRKLFVPGLISGSFPQSVRSLPLLSSLERPKVLGGTIESQFAFAGCLYANFLAAAPSIVLSRPAIAKDGEINIASPFWTKEGERTIETAMPWKHELPAMQRTRWVQQSISNIPDSVRVQNANGISGPDSSSFQIQPLQAPDSISISELQSALLCPARYFFRHILGLKALEEFEPGIPPLERGRNIHSILAQFVSRAMPMLEQSALDFEDLADLLKETAADVIGARMSHAVWQVEFERLTGKSGYPGLLLKLLAAEADRMLEGWSWRAVERSFEGMQIEGCKIRLKGRLDRIDFHPEQGLICWDYKTGRLPSRTEVIDENNQPQLPAYLLALSRGHVTGAPKGRGNLGAGFVELSSPGNMKHKLMFHPAEEHGPFLKDWERGVCEALNSITAGNISPLWLKEGEVCEEHCEFSGVCGSPGGKGN